jgi:hypothetical protein
MVNTGGMQQPGPIEYSASLPPGKIEFTTVAAAQAAVPGLQVPRSLPADAKLVVAQFWYPPKLIVQQNRVVGTDYNVMPSLDGGHLLLNYSLSNGMLAIDQGRFAVFANPQSAQLGPATPRQLSSGRVAFTRVLSGPGHPPGGVNVVAWSDDQAGYRFSAYSNVLTLDQLFAVVDSA